ncbi:MAG: ATP-grasp domain-containing protein [Pseudomonadota bacterium]
MSGEKDKIVIFPAAQYQIPLFQAAQARGLEVITFDREPKNPGHKVAEYAAVIDVRDAEQVVTYLSDFSFHAIAVPCSDISLQTLALIGERFGLKAPSAQLVEQFTNKIAFRRLQSDHGLHCPPHLEVDVADPDLDQVFNDDTDRLVVKPNQSSGSKGISIIGRHSPLAGPVAYAKANSLDGRVLVEACVDGAHGTFEGFLVDGKIGPHIVTKRIRHTDGIGTVGHVVPSDFPKTDLDSLHSSLVTLFSLFDYRSGPVDADFILNDKGLTIVEASPRLGGNALSRLFEVATCEASEDLYLDWLFDRDLPAQNTIEIRPSAALLLTSPVPGKLRFNDAKMKSFVADWLIHIELDYADGDDVRAFKDGRDRIGELILLCDDHADGLRKRDWLLEHIEYEIVAHQVAHGS